MKRIVSKFLVFGGLTVALVFVGFAARFALAQVVDYSNINDTFGTDGGGALDVVNNFSRDLNNITPGGGNTSGSGLGDVVPIESVLQVPPEVEPGTLDNGSSNTNLGGANVNNYDHGSIDLGGSSGSSGGITFAEVDPEDIIIPIDPVRDDGTGNTAGNDDGGVVVQPDNSRGDTSSNEGDGVGSEGDSGQGDGVVINPDSTADRTNEPPREEDPPTRTEEPPVKVEDNGQSSDGGSAVDSNDDRGNTTTSSSGGGGSSSVNKKTRIYIPANTPQVVKVNTGVADDGVTQTTTYQPYVRLSDLDHKISLTPRDNYIAVEISGSAEVITAENRFDFRDISVETGNELLASIMRADAVSTENGVVISDVALVETIESEIRISVFEKISASIGEFFSGLGNAITDFFRPNLNETSDTDLTGGGFTCGESAPDLGGQCGGTCPTGQTCTAVTKSAGDESDATRAVLSFQSADEGFVSLQPMTIEVEPETNCECVDDGLASNNADVNTTVQDTSLMCPNPDVPDAKKLFSANATASAVVTVQISYPSPETSTQKECIDTTNPSDPTNPDYCPSGEYRDVTRTNSAPVPPPSRYYQETPEGTTAEQGNVGEVHQRTDDEMRQALADQIVGYYLSAGSWNNDAAKEGLADALSAAMTSLVDKMDDQALPTCPANVKCPESVGSGDNAKKCPNPCGISDYKVETTDLTEGDVKVELVGYTTGGENTGHSGAPSGSQIAAGLSSVDVSISQDFLYQVGVNFSFACGGKVTSVDFPKPSPSEGNGGTPVNAGGGGGGAGAEQEQLTEPTVAPPPVEPPTDDKKDDEPKRGGFVEDLLDGLKDLFGRIFGGSDKKDDSSSVESETGGDEGPDESGTTGDEGDKGPEGPSDEGPNESGTLGDEGVDGPKGMEEPEPSDDSKKDDATKDESKDSTSVAPEEEDTETPPEEPGDRNDDERRFWDGLTEWLNNLRGGLFGGDDGSGDEGGKSNSVPTGGEEEPPVTPPVVGDPDDKKDNDPVNDNRPLCKQPVLANPEALFSALNIAYSKDKSIPWSGDEVRNAMKSSESWVSFANQVAQASRSVPSEATKAFQNFDSSGAARFKQIIEAATTCERLACTGTCTANYAYTNSGLNPYGTSHGVISNLQCVCGGGSKTVAPTPEKEEPVTPTEPDNKDNTSDNKKDAGSCKVLDGSANLKLNNYLADQANNHGEDPYGDSYAFPDGTCQDQGNTCSPNKCVPSVRITESGTCNQFGCTPAKGEVVCSCGGSDDGKKDENQEPVPVESAPTVAPPVKPVDDSTGNSTETDTEDKGGHICRYSYRTTINVYTATDCGPCAPYKSKKNGGTGWLFSKYSNNPSVILVPHNQPSYKSGGSPGKGFPTMKISVERVPDPSNDPSCAGGKRKSTVWFTPSKSLIEESINSLRSGLEGFAQRHAGHSNNIYKASN